MEPSEPQSEVRTEAAMDEEPNDRDSEMNERDTQEQQNDSAAMEEQEEQAEATKEEDDFDEIVVGFEEQKDPPPPPPEGVGLQFQHTHRSLTLPHVLRVSRCFCVPVESLSL